VGVRRRVSVLLPVVAALCVGGPAAVAARPAAVTPSSSTVPSGAPGALDPTFSGDGVATVSFGNILRPAAMLDTAVRPDGRLYAVGTTYDGPTWLLGTTASGAQDATFGSGGQVVLSGEEVSEVVATPDGKVVYVAQSSTTSQVSLVRRTAAGALDTTFSGDGILPLATTSEASATVQPDGKVLVVVGRVGNAVQVRRYAANGTVDSGFGTNGVAMVAVNNDSGTGRALVAPGGDVLVVATTQNSGGSPSTSRVARLTPAGVPRTTFGGGGVAMVPFAVGAAVDPSGRFLASCGWAYSGGGCVLRLTPTGQLDPTFAGDGIWESTLAGAPFLGQIDTDATGRPLVAGFDNATNSFPMTVLRLTTSGALDAAFSGDGQSSTTPCQGANSVFGMDVDVTGRPVVALACSRSTHGRARAALVRLTTAGVPDASFDGDGVARYGQVRDRYESGDVVLGLPDGRVIAVGTAEELGVTVTRLTADGTPDPAFSADGSVAVWVPIDPEVVAAKVDASGRVVVLISRGGRTGAETEYDVLRLTSAGVLDPAFGSGGRRPLAGILDPWAMAHDGAGRVVLTGAVSATGEGTVVRLDDSGNPDPTFSGDGRVTIENSQSAVAVDGSGRVVVTEAQWAGDVYTQSVRRYLGDGTPDPAFGGGDGQAEYPPDGLFAPELIGTQPDGGLLLCATGFDVACRRLGSSGTVDATYGDHGLVRVTTGRESTALDMLVDGLGRVVLVTDCATDGFGRARQLVRLTPRGLPDSTFGPGGVVELAPSLWSAPRSLGLGAGSTILGISGAAPAAGRVDIAVTRFDNGSSAPATARFVPLAPARLLDTRVGIGRPGTTAPGPAATVTFQVAGRGGVPATGVSAVTLTVTAAHAVATGYVTAFASGTARPTASVLNVRSGETIANQVIVPVGTDGRVSLYTSGGGHLLADVAGYYERVETSTSGRFVSTSPSRLLDSRSGAPLSPFATRTVQVAGRGGIPATGATAVVVNVTAVQPTGAGYLTIWPDGTRPTVSNLNVPQAGQTIAGHATVRLGADGAIRVAPSTSTHLLVDVVGWFTGPGAATSIAGLFVGTRPTRVIDSRGGWTTVGGAGNPDPVATGVPVPRRGADAVVLNLTAAGPRTAGYLTAFPEGTTRPGTSNLNVAGAGRTIANLVTVRVPQSDDEFVDGRVNVWTSSDTPRLLDVSGWYVRWPVP
jgi:uncharacterized delta-60 repeat protein